MANCYEPAEPLGHIFPDGESQSCAGLRFWVFHAAPFSSPALAQLGEPEQQAPRLPENESNKESSVNESADGRKISRKDCAGPLVQRNQNGRTDKRAPNGPQSSKNDHHGHLYREGPKAEDRVRVYEIEILGVKGAPRSREHGTQDARPQFCPVGVNADHLSCFVAVAERSQVDTRAAQPSHGRQRNRSRKAAPEQ